MDRKLRNEIRKEIKVESNNVFEEATCPTCGEKLYEEEILTINLTWRGQIICFRCADMFLPDLHNKIHYILNELVGGVPACASLDKYYEKVEKKVKLLNRFKKTEEAIYKREPFRYHNKCV